MTVAEPGGLPARILNKRPEYLRSASTSSQGSDGRRKADVGSDGRRKTAAERLEADKLKYVKSAQVRRRRATTENLITTITNSNSGLSRRSNANGDSEVKDDECNGVATADRINVLTSNHLKEQPKSTHVTSATDRLQLSESDKLNKKDKPDPTSRIRSSEDGVLSKSVSAYLTKINEKLNPSTISNSNDVKTRLSRPAVAKSSKYRSSSVGAIQLRTSKETAFEARKQCDTVTSTDKEMMSPRSQLKNARLRLKKISNQTMTQSSNSRFRSKTFAVAPNLNDENSAERESCKDVKLRQTSSESVKSPRNLNRPLSVIENKAAPYMLDAMLNGEKKAKQETIENVVRRRQKIKEETTKDSHASPGSARARLISLQPWKRRSWDISHTLDNSLHVASTKHISMQPPPSPQQVQATPLTSLPQSFQKKSWSSRISPEDARKCEGKAVVHEDSRQNRACAKKSVTASLAEIINSQEQDMDTTYQSVSPDASMDCKTLVGPSSVSGKSGETLASSINNVLQGGKIVGSSLRSKTPESLRSSTPTGEDGMSFGGTEAIPSSQESAGGRKGLSQSSPEAARRHDNPVEEQRQWVNGDGVITSSQPLNRIDLAPSDERNGEIPNSPMLAPRLRREVAPDYSKRLNNPILNRCTSRDDPLSTMRSQNTSSSASGDINKPFTALTASDLKPKRTKTGAITSRSTPLKPSTPYSASHRVTPKRHNNAPLSPTPHKQSPRASPNHGSRSTSSTPYSSLKRNPTSPRSSSLRRNRQRSKSDVSTFHSELDRFFATMGMGELVSSRDNLAATAHVSSESDFSFAGASAYVRDSPDERMEVDPFAAPLAAVPSVSIIEKNARVMKWLMACKKTLNPAASLRTNPQPHKPPVPQRYPSYPPPIPPRLSSYQTLVTCAPKESDV